LLPGSRQGTAFASAAQSGPRLSKEIQMNRFLLTVGVLWLAFAATGPALASPPGDADRMALQQLAAANDAAWGAKDVATISTQYVADGSVRVAPQAPVIYGREQVIEFFDRAFARRQGTHRHITVLDNIELISPDMALADAGVRVERRDPDGNWTLVRTFRSVSLAVREGGIWRLRSVRAIPMN
jgi:ketosteroid isomerase-like protein